jgi:hypothetical protein
MNAMVSRRLIAGLVAATLSLSPMTTSAQDETITGDKGSDMLVDLVLVRPFSLAATLIGMAAFVVALPFTIPSNSVKDAGENMIVPPASATFKRPLGEFNENMR